MTPQAALSRARQPSRDDRVQRALRIGAIVFLLSLVVFATFHEPTHFAHAMQKLAHPVTFGAIALLLLTLPRHPAPRPLGPYVGAFALTVLCGAATEVTQAFVHRDPSVFDVLRDALGAGTALAAFATLIPGSDAHGRGKWRALGALSALVGVAIMVAPISISLAAYARRDLSFPALLDPCSALDQYFLTVRGADSRLVPATAPTTSTCGKTLRFTLSTAPYAGFMLDEPYPDWRLARALVLDLRNPGELDLALAVRVHDRAHNFQYQDRFNREFMLRAHERLELAIPIGEIERAPAGRSMDLSQIAGIALFRAGGTTAGAFEVERILLQR